MLERLVGRLLNNVLAKYFVSQKSNTTTSSNNNNNEATEEGAQPSLGVWSGYIALDNLTLRTEVVNDILERQGIPLQVLHCTIRRVEITVPWSKLRSNESKNAVVVIVMDGIHVLARTLYEYHDEKIRAREIQQRRAKLQEAQQFEHQNQKSGSSTPQTSSSSWYSLGGWKEVLKQRLSEGLLQQITDKLHVHIRDLHIRLEDAETDPVNPFACGIVMESMHVQHWEDTKQQQRNHSGSIGEEDNHEELFASTDGNGNARTSRKEFVRKVAQINHYGVYWNALAYEEGTSLEHAVMHQLPSLNSPQLLAAALDRGIARRASALWSSGGVVPTHTYLLMPMDCSLQAVLTMDPTGLTNIPSIDATFHVEAINVQLRDFQCHQLSLLLSAMKEHKFTKPYRRFRPQFPVKENPAAWWRYAFRVISYELKGSRLRWSWGRMRQKYAGRQQYCQLYERQVKHAFYRSHITSSQQSLTDLMESTFDTTPDDGAGPSFQTSDTNSSVASLDSQQQQQPSRQDEASRRQQSEVPRPLTEMEARELQDLEDGVSGDLTVQDILLYRLLVHNRLGLDYQAQQQQAVAGQSFTESWIFGNAMVQNAMKDDLECQLEVQRLLAYLEHSSTREESKEESQQERQNISFLSIRFHWKEGCLAIFSPLSSTANEASFLRRLHERFLDFSFERLSLGVSLMGDYETASINLSLRDYSITEIRSNQQRIRYPILYRRQACENSSTSEPAPSRGPSVDRNLSAKGRVSFSEDDLLNSQPEKKNSSPTSPLVFAEVQIKPPQADSCRISVSAKIEAVEVVLVPDCQWIRRLKEFLRHSSASGGASLEDYWKGLNYASMNAWASKSLGLRAKAETAMEGHSSINLDIFLFCPFIQIIGSDEKKIWIDLGRAHFKTVKLAGVALSDLNQPIVPQTQQQALSNGVAGPTQSVSDSHQQVSLTNEMDRSERSINQEILSPNFGVGAYFETPTPAFGLENHTIASSPTRPHDTFQKRNRQLGESFRSSGMYDLERMTNHPRAGDASIVAGGQASDIHSSFFYDIYQLQITTGDTVIGEICKEKQNEEDKAMPVLSGLNIQLNIHKSIIPADHTLCRLRLDFFVSEISASASPNTISYMSSILRTWKVVMTDPIGFSPQRSFSLQRQSSVRQTSFSEFSSTIPNSSLEDPAQQSASIENGSNVDEDEFFDAVENDENSEYMTMWLEDNWIADAESVLDGDVGSISQKQRRHKAMSDVSSLSDRSIKKRMRPKETSAYLNEENLARLEEGKIEEGSMEEDDNESASFHSAWSPSHVADLLDELDKSIKDSRDGLAILKQKLDDLAEANKKDQSLSSLNSDSTKHRRLIRKSLKLEQERVRAELNEMIATRHDLSAQLLAIEEDNSAENLGVNGFGASADRAKALLSSKINGKSFDATAMQHSLTRHQNPQLIQCTVVLSKVSAKLTGLKETKGGEDGDTLNAALFVSECALAIRHSVNETKLLFSIESVSTSIKESLAAESSQHFVFLGGPQYSLASKLLSTHFPHFISSSAMDEKFARLTLELRHRPSATSNLTSPEIFRLRVALGDVEVAPEPRFFGALSSCQNAISTNNTTSMDVLKTDDAHTEPRARAIPAFIDVSVQFVSARVVLVDFGSSVGSTVAALSITEMAGRFAQSSSNTVYKSRQQLDLRCSNVQAFHIENLHLGKGSEIFGRRDPYLPLFQARIRSQLVPSSEVGGWVTGEKITSPMHISEEENGRDIAWNVHAGVKVNCFGATFAGPVIRKIQGASRRLLFDSPTVGTSQFAGTKKAIQEDTSKAFPPFQALTEKQESKTPVRWRADLVIKKTTITLASNESKEMDPRDGAHKSIIFNWTLLASLEECQHKEETTNIQLALTDVSILQTLNELQVLEPLDIVLKGHINKSPHNQKRIVPNLKLPVDSSWNEIAAIIHRHGWDVSRDEFRLHTPNCLALLVTATRIKVSAQLINSLVEIAKSFSSPVDAPPRVGESTVPEPRGIDNVAPDFYLFTAVRSVDLDLVHETGSRSSDLFASVAIDNMETTFHKRNNTIFLGGSLTDFIILDLSSRPGVCALARRYYKREPTDPSRIDREFLSWNLEIAHSESAALGKLDLQFGQIRSIVLPSLVQGIVAFKSEMMAMLPPRGTEIEDKEGANKIPFVLRPCDVFFSFVVDGFDCVLSSKDILGYVREQTHAPINVVSFRWKSRGEAMFVSCGLDKASYLLQKCESKTATQASLPGLSDLEDLVHHFSVPLDLDVSKLLATKVVLSVEGFQVLRTSIVPLARREKDSSPLFFRVNPPAAGEQLITSSFDFNLCYQSFGALACLRLHDTQVNEHSKPEMSIEYSHSLSLDIQLVDVLVYIAQSTGGINEAFRVTVAPIVEILTRKDGREEVPSSDMTERKTTAPNSLCAVIKKAPLLFTIEAGGIRVTMVPGGATRLTESPIINFSLRKFSLGLAMCMVPVESTMLTESALGSIVTQERVISNLQEMHNMIGAWLNCELTASYHNRRLVAWEPFIEPWKIDVRFGADLVKLLNFPPLPSPVHSDFQAQLGGGEAALPTDKGERLRDIRNLLLSPLRRKSVGSERDAEKVTPKELPLSNDFGYAMLVLAAKKSVASALHPSIASSRQSVLDVRGELPSYIPSKTPLKWLVCFGYPPLKAGENIAHATRPSFSCALSDTKPLNINLTGALIENVLGYLKQEKSRSVAPHWIRNDSGLTLRFREVLEEERAARGERASKVTLSNGSEVPLSLKRTLSQSSDPHRAYIFIELGSFEDTAGRVDQEQLMIQKGSLSTTFFYKVVAKVPVDTVGVHRYPLDRNVDLRSSQRAVDLNSRSLGWIIVRVALQGGIKLVSVESPLVLKNNTDADLLCEVRTNDKLSLLWRCLVPKPEGKNHSARGSNVPVDIVPYVNDKSFDFTVEALPRNACFRHESELITEGGGNAIQIEAPRPFSDSSVSRGVIKEVDVTFKAMDYGWHVRDSDNVHLNVCSLRLGTFATSEVGSEQSDSIPEQRMLLFRSPLAVRNHLAFPIAVQVRVKRAAASNKLSSSSLVDLGDDGWEDLGVLDCGETKSWTGAISNKQVEMRVRFVASDPESSRKFDSWSSVGTIPAMNSNWRSDTKQINKRASITSFSKIHVLDTSGLSLDISFATSGGLRDNETSNVDNIKQFASSLAPSSRLVSLYVPYWIVDGTGQDLEFSARSLLAGQVDSRPSFHRNDELIGSSRGLTLGLAELLEDAKLSHLPSKSIFSVLLLGDDRSRNLSIRQRVSRENAGKRIVAPWSDPISLRGAENRHFDVTVMPPPTDTRKGSKEKNGVLEPYALRSRTVSAPEKFGGKLGTKIVHIVCRYTIVNELGREIEIIAEHSRGTPVLVRADGKPKPFHFDDSGPIQFRPKEFGWVWSGRFLIQENRREVTLRIRHKLKQQTIVVNAEIHAKEKSGTRMIVLRPASHPPFRFENNTMYPLCFVQTYLATDENDIRYNREVASSETILLPYHHEDFAWDEPEHTRKSVQFEVADFGEKVSQPTLGRFNLERIAPGTELKMKSDVFVGQVFADGPTRVLRISESSMPRLPRSGLSKEVKFINEDEGQHTTFSVQVKLTHGVGLSVIDWTPQELLFLRLEEISVSQHVDSNKQTVEASVGRISIDNQIWISPYPVLLEMGSRKLASTLAHIARRKSKRHRAVTLSLCRPLLSREVYGDLAFFEWIDLVTDPINIFVDGNLASSLLRMGKQIVDLGSNGDDSRESRDLLLCKVLNIPANSQTKRKFVIETSDIYSAGDAVTTAAIAAKARSNREYFTESMAFRSTQNAIRSDSLTKGRRKSYIEKLRISTTKLEISWSGSLAFLSLPGLMPLSFTFEGFPLLLRPYSSSHAYGTAEDQLQALKRHYLSKRRIFDLLFGLLAKPTFMINAFVHTLSESIASSFGLIAQSLNSSKERLLLKLRETEPQPTYDDGLAVRETRPLRWTLAGPFVRILAWYVQHWETAARFGSSFFRYDPTRYAGSGRRRAGLVRSRNPRLFASVDGKDLLVEYTEGENAGKALLSRIRMGMHLGEGYIYHVEGTYRKVMTMWSKPKRASGILILMLTFERMMLVKGELSADFCSVIWEATFDNMIEVETRQSEDPGYSLLTVWYLSSALPKNKKSEDLVITRYAKSVVSDLGGGFENLLSIEMYVPHAQVRLVRKKAMEAKRMESTTDHPNVSSAGEAEVEGIQQHG